MKRPVGLIGAYYGGRQAEAWTSLDGLEKDAELAPYVAQWRQIDAGYGKAIAGQARYEAAVKAYEKAAAEWDARYAKDFDQAMAQWRLAEATGGRPLPHPTPLAPAPEKPAGPDGGAARAGIPL